ncbi:MAG: IS66 family insertion sequence element accessory protein TnpB [candidate division WOR-3 bacterium]
MLYEASARTKVYLAVGAVDMRKAINGLSMLVQGTLALDPFSGHVFGFCNRRRSIVKVLYWDRNGFCLWQKRLEREVFRWPESAEQVLEIGMRELGWLVEGLDMKEVKGHRALNYRTVV